ncbi:UvrD-helicase domain-containing protein [Pseudomonas wenzhouensis]|uniref:UvrD-helicase domain-containing protein n=1 Tax=Pseudomonas wenzhouensis TaxID=2906062 RepID=UPI001E2990E5|nr:UvrD-helicase domain-containing protein [Pseudomonas wenzhouensis]UFQ96292.1 UvrD-helicase domain-containing protein [Pseudomonas wenzhouensis]
MTKRLTWEQKNIVSHDTGHALVKAVPGSGKTTTLVKRVERLVKTGADPRSILILMYNKSAQLGFTEKLKTALKSTAIPEVRTFHSLALKIVGYGERQQIIKKKDLLTPGDYRYEQLVKQAYRHGFDHEASYIAPSEIENFELFIARCRAAVVTPVDAATDPTFSNIKREFIFHRKVKTTGFQPVSFSATMRGWRASAWITDTAVIRSTRSSITLFG